MSKEVLYTENQLEVARGELIHAEAQLTELMSMQESQQVKRRMKAFDPPVGTPLPCLSGPITVPKTQKFGRTFGRAFGRAFGRTFGRAFGRTSGRTVVGGARVVSGAEKKII